MNSANRSTNDTPTLRIVQSQYSIPRSVTSSTTPSLSVRSENKTLDNSLSNTSTAEIATKLVERVQEIQDHARQNVESCMAVSTKETSNEIAPVVIGQNPEQTPSNSGPNVAISSTAGKSQTQQNGSSTPEDSAVELTSGPYQLPLDPSARPNAKLKNKYVMSDGTVVNGKGLGRGRPGIKRGSRKSTLSEEVISIDDDDSVTEAGSISKSKEQSGSNKRKRDTSEILSETYETLSDFSKDSTPEYNPTSTQTRSGRQSNKPVPIIVPTPTTASPASKRPALTPNVSSPSIKKHPKIKAKVYRGREQFALCEHCLRGNGPPGNAIVFCDACNKCWHQRCHDPKIPRQVVADTKAEWFCSDCDRILHGKKKTKLQPSKPAVAAQPPPPQPQAQSQIIAPSSSNNTTSKPLTFGPPITAAGNLTFSQQKSYLNSLTKDKLIEIVLKAAALAPLLPIMETPILPKAAQNFIPPPRPIPGQLPYPPPPHPPQPIPTAASATPPPAQPIPQFTSNYTTPVDKMPVFGHASASNASTSGSNPSAQTITNEDEGYFDDFDEHGELYPKPGEGAYNLALPPESGDLGILLEGPECRTFSHWLKSSGVGYKRTLDAVK